MICGPGGAGKTTTLAALLMAADGRVQLLSNDRLIVQERGVVAVPLPVRQARGTLNAFPELHTACIPAPVRTLPSVFGTISKVALPARTFADALGSRLDASGHLRALTIPRLKDDTQLPYAERLSSGEARQALRQACFTPLDEFWSPWLVPRTRSEAALAALAEAARTRLAAELPCPALPPHHRRYPCTGRRARRNTHRPDRRLVDGGSPEACGGSHRRQTRHPRQPLRRTSPESRPRSAAALAHPARTR